MIVVVAHGPSIADDLSLDVMGPEDLRAGIDVTLTFNDNANSQKVAHVIDVEDHGAVAILMIDQQRWRLLRRIGNAVGAMIAGYWTVYGKETPPPSAERFFLACRALFGDNYTAQMASYLNVREARVRAWANGSLPNIPTGVWTDIDTALRVREPQIARARFEVAQQLAAQRDADSRRSGQPFVARIGAVPASIGHSSQPGPGPVFGWEISDRNDMHVRFDDACDRAGVNRGDVQINANTMTITHPSPLAKPEFDILTMWLRKEVDRLMLEVSRRSGGKCSVAVEMQDVTWVTTSRLAATHRH